MTVDYSAIRATAELASHIGFFFRDALIVVGATRSGANVLYPDDLTHGQAVWGVA